MFVTLVPRSNLSLAWSGMSLLDFHTTFLRWSTPLDRAPPSLSPTSMPLTLRSLAWLLEPSIKLLSLASPTVGSESPLASPPPSPLLLPPPLPVPRALSVLPLLLALLPLPLLPLVSLLRVSCKTSHARRSPLWPLLSCAIGPMDWSITAPSSSSSLALLPPELKSSKPSLLV